VSGGIDLPDFGFEVGAFSDVGTEREHNEDSCGYHIESATSALIAVADGVSSSAGGETASRMAIEILLREYREQRTDLGIGRRLSRAIQRANIEVYELALTVPELAGMATTLTAVAIDRGEVVAAHVGDSRLYRARGGTIAQLTKDHTAAAEQVRLGLLSERRARHHPGRSLLTRSLGRELIVGLDRLSFGAAQGDVLVLCSDGLYNVLGDSDIELLVRGATAEAASRALVDAANQRGTFDNVTAAVLRVTGSVPAAPRQSLGAWLRRLAETFGGRRRHGPQPG
jgi:serine/threonine protein phosphatase PrpC